MNRTDAQEIVKAIHSISNYVRFVAVINSKGKVIAYERRLGHKPLLDTRNTKNQFSHIAVKTGMSTKFDRQLGKVQFMWEERKKVQTISFAINKNTAWISIDKNVIRSEVLRIVDNCLPIVKRFT